MLYLLCEEKIDYTAAVEPFYLVAPLLRGILMSCISERPYIITTHLPECALIVHINEYFCGFIWADHTYSMGEMYTQMLPLNLEVCCFYFLSMILFLSVGAP